jgi:hypothetical protein
MQTQIMSIFTVDELAEKVVELLEARQTTRAQPNASGDDTLLTISEACELLGITPPTLNDWQKQGLIEGKSGEGTRNVRYKKGKLLASFEAMDYNNQRVRKMRRSIHR